MGNPEHVAILNQSVDRWNRWRRENPAIIPNLSGVEMRAGDLREVDFSRAFFGYGMPSRGGVFCEAGFEKADLRRANLSYANLVGAELAGADLRDADLFRTVFGKCNLHGVQFAGAHMSGTIFAEVNLNGAEGLDEVRHTGPSTIGIDTIYISEGRIPEHFLWNAGVPDVFITFARSLVGQAIQFYSCFISYSTGDQDFVDRLHADLQHNGVRCWFAAEDLKIGDPFRQRIDEAIRLHEKLLVVLSANSVRSDWVREEVEACLDREHRENRLVLFPVRLDEAVMDTDQAWAAAIRRQRHIGDFRKWNDHAAYQQAFQRLLRDLKA